MWLLVPRSPRPTRTPLLSRCETAQSSAMQTGEAQPAGPPPRRDLPRVRWSCRGPYHVASLSYLSPCLSCRVELIFSVSIKEDRWRLPRLESGFKELFVWVTHFSRHTTIVATSLHLYEFLHPTTKSPRPAPRAFAFTVSFSLLADLDSAPAATATTATTCGAAGRDNLDPKCVFAFVVRGAGCAAQCIEAVLCCARRCGGESR